MNQTRSTPREVAQRVFAREFSEATYTSKETDEDRAPVYALLPTRAKANRIFVVGILTETDTSATTPSHPTDDVLLPSLDPDMTLLDIDGGRGVPIVHSLVLDHLLAMAVIVQLTGGQTLVQIGGVKRR